MTDAVNVGMMAGVDSRDKVVVGLGVADVAASMQRFGWIDYTVFFLMLMICVVIGYYYGFVQTATSVQDYLLGGRTMKTFPISMSLIARHVLLPKVGGAMNSPLSPAIAQIFMEAFEKGAISLTKIFISGISLLGIPTEMYVYGIHYVYITGGLVLMGFIMDKVYLPVFHNLKLMSTYEYLEKRFDRRVRIYGSVLFVITLIAWLPIVIYVPGLAFNQITGVNVHYITPVVCVICIFYTSAGGLRAVVWTDVIQTLIMIGAMILVIVKGTFDIGGAKMVWTRNWETSRIEPPSLDPSPFARHSIWALLFGGCIYWLQSGAVDQNMMQRYLSLPNLKAARRSLWLFIVGYLVVLYICAYAGLLIYATYHKCDPLTTTLAKEKDQLLPLLVMEVLGDLPGLPGLFIAGIFSAALSSLSTGLNAMAAVVLEDFYRPFFNKPLSQRHTKILMKSTVILMGVVCVALVFVVEKLGAVLQLTMTAAAIANGPLLGMFSMGMLLPWINSRGALTGGVCSLIFMSWLCLKAQAAIAAGDILFPEKPVTTEGCHYHFIPKNHPSKAFSNATEVTHAEETFMLYRISYLWYTLVGTIVAIVVGVITSFLYHPNDPHDVDQELLAPFVRKFIKPREFPNQPNGNDIIYAYERPEIKMNVRQNQISSAEVEGPQSA